MSTLLSRPILTLWQPSCKIAALLLSLTFANAPKTLGAQPGVNGQQDAAAPRTVKARPLLWDSLAPGAFAVSFRLQNVSDSTRRGLNATGRSLQLSMWYPSPKGVQARPLKFGDYVRYFQFAANASGSTRWQTAYQRSWFPGASAHAVATLLATPVYAARNAVAAEGRFPVVLYIPALGGTPLTHTVTCEFLASHGYVVLSIPATGSTELGQPFDEAGQETLIRDFEFGLGILARNRFADVSRIGVIGFSMGGGAALLTAMSNVQVRLVVSLDGTIGWTDAQSLVRKSARYSPPAMRVPLLHFGVADDPENDLSLMKELTLAPRTVFLLREVDHHDFIARNVIAKRVTGNITNSARQGYLFTTRTLLDALNHAVRGASVLSPTDLLTAGLAPETFADRADIPALTHIPISTDIAEMLSRGATFQRGMELYERARQALPTSYPPASVAQLELAGDRLTSDKRVNLATRVFKLLERDYPLNDKGSMALGQLYQQVGDTACARSAFAEALRRNPANRSATQALRKVEMLPISSPC